MFDTVQLMLRMSYYYARFLGALNFEINTRTGQARITTRSTIYAAVANVAIICFLPLLSQSELIRLMWTNAGLLYEYIFLVVMGIRIVCILATLFSRWLQRQHLIRLVNAFRLLSIEKPQVIQMWRRGVIIKFMTIFASEFIQMCGSVLTLQTVLTANMIISVFLLYMLTALVNVIISHYYFAMLNVHNHYILLNQEMREVLSEARSLENELRKATFMIKCCSIADRLEAIARRQSELQELISLMGRIFGIQGLCVSANSYMTSIGSVYFSFTALKNSAGMKWNAAIILLLTIEIGAYFVDVLVTIFNIYNVIDDHAEFVQLLEEYSTFATGLDERLEAVFESFQLQLARNPLKISILGLYNMDRTIAISMTNAIVSNSLVLIQYELKNPTIYYSTHF